MSIAFESLLERVKQDFVRFRETPPVPVKQSRIPKSAGVYVFYEGGKPLRVGTTKNLQARIRQHYRNNHRSAAFAKQLARNAMKIPGTPRSPGWNAEKELFPGLCGAFQAARGRIREMCVAWFEMDEREADRRYLLEFYAAKELQTPYNDFSET